MERVFLIGLPEAVVQKVSALVSAAGLEFEIADVPAPETFARTVRSPLVIIGGNQWVPWLAGVPAECRPPSYVILDNRTLAVSKQESYFGNDAIGCGSIAHIDQVLDDLSAKLRIAAEPVEAPAFKVGDLVDAGDKPDANPSLVGWGLGALGSFFGSIRSIESRLTSLVATSPRIEHPFTEQAPAATWLDLYSFLESGGVLTKDEGDALFARVKASVRVKDHKAFIDLFLKRFVQRQSFVPPPILILGETGTGKSIAAKRLHSALWDASRPFYHVNCSTLGDMADTELFGALRGAYTSLDQTNPGAVFSTYGGTLFLDEFGSLSPRTQAKLLLFLEDGTLRPMAWTGPPLRVPVLVIAATNERLADRAQRGEFRADLFYRFRGGTVTLPPLRETKRTDLRYLVDYMLQSPSINPRNSVDSVGDGAIAKLDDHDYPGNVRELQSVLAQAVERAAGRRSSVLGAIDVEFPPSTLPRQDAVVAIVTRCQGRDRQVLLIWNAYWRNWFLPGGRVEAETFEQCLARELSAKLGLEPNQYGAVPIPAAPDLQLIQHSVRDGKLKQYFFRTYTVTLNEEALNSIHRRDSARWVPLSELEARSTDPTLDLSATVPRLLQGAGLLGLRIG